MKKILFALATCLVGLSQPLRAQLVDSLTVEEIISHSSTVIRGTAPVRECPKCILVNCICSGATRQNDRIRISGTFPPCDPATSKVNYIICDSVIIADIILQAPTDQQSAYAIEADFGPCTADDYTLYVRYNRSSPMSFSTEGLNADICADGYTVFPLGKPYAVGQVSILTPEPKVDQPVTAQVSVDYYKGVDSLTITSVEVRPRSGYNLIYLTGSCKLGSGSSTHAVTTVSIDSIPYPGNYGVKVSIDDLERQTETTINECNLKVTAPDDWHAPRTMDYFLNKLSFSSIKEGEPFTIFANWSSLVLPDTQYKLPTMQVDSLSDHKVFISVHYDATVDVPYDFLSGAQNKVTVPGLKGGKGTVVFTGVDEAGRYNYPPCERTFDVEYHRYTGTIIVGDADRQPADEEGRNDLTFSFEGDSIHVQGLLWMRYGSSDKVKYVIQGHDIQFYPSTWGNTRKATGRFPVDFYLSPCPLDDYTISMYGIYYKDGQSQLKDTFYVARQPDISSIWVDGSQWDVIYYEDADGQGTRKEYERVTYSLWGFDDSFSDLHDSYLALHKTTRRDGQTVSDELQGYIRSEGDTLIYVRPILPDGSIGSEELLYDFREPFEYGGILRYGTLGGEVQEEVIDWKQGLLDYYVIAGGDGRCLPAWNGLVYGYGFLDGPMEMYLSRQSHSTKSEPRPTNISHVIFTTKSGHKASGTRGTEGGEDVEIPYDEMLLAGTVWECLEVPATQPGDMRTYTIQVKADVTLAGRQCKRVYSPEKDIWLTLLEEGRKIYVVSDDETPAVLLDFGLQEGDGKEPMRITTGTIENQGYSYRRILINTGLNVSSPIAADATPWCYSLIEGIGISKDEFLTCPHPFSGEGTVTYLLRCWKDGTLVYQASEYAPLGIGEVRPASSQPQTYDLQGRPVAHPTRGIYIMQQGGKAIKTVIR